MEVTVRFFSFFRNIAGCAEVRVKLDNSRASMHDLFKVLNARLGKDFTALIGKKVEGDEGLQRLIFVNGKNLLQQGGMETPLHDGDEVSFLPPMEGG